MDVFDTVADLLPTAVHTELCTPFVLGHSQFCCGFLFSRLPMWFTNCLAPDMPSVLTKLVPLLLGSHLTEYQSV